MSHGPPPNRPMPRPNTSAHRVEPDHISPLSGSDSVAGADFGMAAMPSFPDARCDVGNSAEADDSNETSRGIAGREMSFKPSGRSALWKLPGA